MRIKRNYIVSKKKKKRFAGPPSGARPRGARCALLPSPWTRGYRADRFIGDRGFFPHPSVDSPMHFELSSTKICSRYPRRTRRRVIYIRLDEIRF